MVYSYYHWIDRIDFFHILCMVGFFHISWSQPHSSVHSCFNILEQRFSLVLIILSFRLVFIFKSSKVFKKSFRQRLLCGCSPPPQCVAPSCLMLPPARRPPWPPWPSGGPTWHRSTCKTLQSPSDSAAASPSGQP